MIKARPVAGSTTLGKDFCERIRPFVYPGVADLNLLDQIRDLKSKIEDSLRHKLTGEADPDRPGYNVKLGAGGIREIEFFVSSLQHLYGGKDPELRVRHTLTAAKQLVAKGLLSSEDAQALTAAYHFLRTTENRLQMVEDRQTHTLPRQAEELETVTGLAAELFYERLQQHTGAVRRLWEQLLNRP